MLSSAESHVTVRPDSVRTGREERRAFLQQRLGVFGLWMFSLSLGFYAVNVAIEATLNADFNWAIPFRPPHGLHLLAAVVCGGLWLVAQGRALSVQALHQIDAIAVVLLCTLYALMGPSFAFRGFVGTRNSAITAFALLSTVLACSNVLIARAIAVQAGRREHVGSPPLHWRHWSLSPCGSPVFIRCPLPFRSVSSSLSGVLSLSLWQRWGRGLSSVYVVKQLGVNGSANICWMRRLARGGWVSCTRRITRCSDAPRRSSCCGPRRRARQTSAGSSRKFNRPPSSVIRTRSPSTITAVLQKACSTTQWSFCRGSTSRISLHFIGRSHPGESYTSSSRFVVRCPRPTRWVSFTETSSRPTSFSPNGAESLTSSRSSISAWSKNSTRKGRA